MGDGPIVTGGMNAGASDRRSLDRRPVQSSARRRAHALTRREWIRVVVTLLAGGAVLFLLLPRTGRLLYEYQRGRIWLHKTLRAPFDYPLYKSETVLRQERERLRGTIRPVFRHDTEVVSSVRHAVEGALRTDYARYYDSLLREAVRRGRNVPKRQLFSEAEYARFSEILAYLYQMGVVRPESVLAHSSNGEFSIMRGRTLYDVWLDDTYSPNSAATLLSHEMVQACEAEYKASFWSDFPLEVYLTPNLEYDSVVSAGVRKTAMESVSLALGMVSRGEVIVERGQVVTDLEASKLESLRYELYQRDTAFDRSRVWQEVGYALMIVLILGIYLLFLDATDRSLLRIYRQFLFLILLFVGSVAVGFVMLRYAPAYLYMLPLAIVPLLIRSFFTPRLAFTTFIVSVSTLALFVADSFSFFFVTLLAGSVAIYGVKNITRRSRLFESMGLVFLAYSVSYTLLQLILEGTLSMVMPQLYGHFAVNALLCLGVYLLMYPVERLFGFVSTATLMELGDSNRPLLRDLAERAPGTFQHSMQVANLAESAASLIGANSLLVRTAALYHDIGKMNRPEYFTENQLGGSSPHAHLSEKESAEIIVAHVTDGVSMAHRHGLPEVIIDFIRTHHGTTRTEYFYRTYRSKHPQEEDHPEWFTYPGPRPFTPEMAILMMADSVEAASRSLKVVTEETLTGLVQGIIAHQQGAGQFDEADISLKDIAQIKQLFIDKLTNIYHSRIAYPEDPDKAKENEEGEKEDVVTE